MSKQVQQPVAHIEGLEGRQLMAAQPLPNYVTGIKIAKVSQTVSGQQIAENSNRIEIAFKTSVRIGATSAFRSFGYSNDLADSSTQRKVTVGLTISHPLDSNGVSEDNVVQIITDRLVRKGSRLTIAAGGLTVSKTGAALVYDASTAATTITFAVGQNKPRFTLSNRNFVPTDLSYFDPAVFTASPTPTTLSTTPNATTIRANLVTFMTKKLNAGIITQAEFQSSLDTFDSSTAMGIFPNANLRAALASLYGTVAEPAIASFLTKANVTGKAWSSFDFGTTSSDAPVGETKLNANGRLYTIVRSNFAGEPFQVLSAEVAHEVLRQDPANNASGNLPDSQDESIIANAVESNVYAQQLLVDPSIAATGSALVVRSNTRLLAMINSGRDLFPYGGIYEDQALTNVANVFVGAKSDPGSFSDTTPVSSYEDWIRREYIFRGFSAGGTPTNPAARAIIGNILGSKAAAKANLTLFGTDTEDALDGKNGSGNTILTDVNYIKLATILKLNF